MKISTHKQKTRNNVMLNKVGIFSASLLAASAAVYFYSPVIGTHASTNTEVDISASVNPVASLTLDTTSVSYSFNPTAAGVFESKPVTATVNTNSTGGYELYFSSVDNDTAMTHASLSNTIASDFSGTVTSSTMAANKWGYSLDNTDFSAIPALSSQATIKNLDHLPSAAERDTTVNVGIKIDSTLPSGLYSKSVIFSVLAHETPTASGTISDIDEMQDITPEICTNSSEGETVILTDARDDNEYTVKKLADGKCWMTDNLRIINIGLNEETSDIASGVQFTIPSSSKTGFTSNDGNNAYIDSTYGGYYTFYTATAGTGGTDINDGDASSSICPKGWRLPIGGTNYSDFGNLYNEYGSSSELLNGPAEFDLNGYAWNNSTYYKDESARYWASNYGATQAYSLSIYGNNVSVNNIMNKYYGYGVRCVAR